MWQVALRMWEKLPVLVRAGLAAFVVLNIGTILGSIPLLANMKLLPRVPWALPVTLILMWGFW